MSTLFSLLITVVVSIISSFIIYYFSLSRIINQYVDLEHSMLKTLCRELNIDSSHIQHITHPTIVRTYDSALEECFKDVRKR
ncbi:hypothetical protein B5723_08085 [Mammaliicoccus sciuri]|uniref:hypothetical protein n=1 Tax=Mammaliicoccus sciuri TaxID=1296 RepID=UPI000A000157|nr:hypothetical protein [Mammaliicoccus sciuri]ORI02831.1 hypothetical protein B5723_08085 [Mammaliicoccus sciuri]